ncbi:MAG TPA: hypothetical protein VMQ76_02280, partial [Terracidiphilus sp.]|nr:hypothetical protein [Terracidiphilus sp.]
MPGFNRVPGLPEVAVRSVKPALAAISGMRGGNRVFTGDLDPNMRRAQVSTDRLALPPAPTEGLPAPAERLALTEGTPESPVAPQAAPRAPEGPIPLPDASAPPVAPVATQGTPPESVKGGAESDLSPEAQAISRANNNRMTGYRKIVSEAKTPEAIASTRKMIEGAKSLTPEQKAELLKGLEPPAPTAPAAEPVVKESSTTEPTHPPAATPSADTVEARKARGGMPMLGVELADGTIISDATARFHSDILEKRGIPESDWASVKSTGFFVNGKYTAFGKTPKPKPTSPAAAPVAPGAKRPYSGARYQADAKEFEKLVQEHGMMPEHGWIRNPDFVAPKEGTWKDISSNSELTDAYLRVLEQLGLKTDRATLRAKAAALPKLKAYLEEHARPDDPGNWPADTSTDFLPPESQGPKLAPGVKQGDLVDSTQRDTLSLSGEVTGDAARIKAEAEAKAKSAAEAKALAEKQQQDLFNKPAAPGKGKGLAGEVRRRLDAGEKPGGEAGGGVPIGDLIHEFGKTVWKKGMAFAEWSKRMISELGDKAKVWLQSVWTKITDLGNFDVRHSTDYNRPYIPVKVRGVDGKVYDAEFNGWQDMRPYGGKLMPSIGRKLASGGWSHAYLRPGETMQTRLPSPEKWSKLQAAEKTREATYVPNEIEAGAGIQIPKAITDTLKKTRDTIKTLARTKGVRAVMAYTKDVAGNVATVYGQRVGNNVRGQLKRAMGRGTTPNVLDENALTFVREADGDRGQLAIMRGKIAASTVASPKWKTAALKAIDHAETNWDKLNPIASQYERATDAQVSAENAAGINTLSRKGYVMHAQDVQNDFGFFSDVAGEGTTGFKHARAYDTFADSIAAGVDPKSINAVALLTQRVARGQMLINNRTWVEGLKTTVDPHTPS